MTITGEFHGLIAELAGNVVLAKFIDELVLRTSLISATLESREVEDCSPDAHPDIAALILARDRERATAAMDAHLRAMEDRLQFGVPPAVAEDLASIFADIGVTRRRRIQKGAE